MPVNQDIAEGAPLGPASFLQAEHTAKALRGPLEIRGDPAITKEVVESAELRATTTRNTHATLEFAPANLLQKLQGISDRLQLLTDQFADGLPDLRKEIRIGRAESSNVSICIKNRSYIPAEPTPLRKEIPGSGLARARALCLNLDQDIRAALDAFAANQPPAEIGTLPSFFNGDIDALEHLDILKLVYFYNHTMGVEARHDLAERKGAVREFFFSLRDMVSC